MKLAISLVALKGKDDHRVAIRGLAFPDQTTARQFAQWLVDGVKLFGAQPGDKPGEPGFVLVITQDAAGASAGASGGSAEDFLSGLNWTEKKVASGSV